jgi:diguanylate cyclase (GGDEF)-like protein/PAS domain S-box-containing protein
VIKGGKFLKIQVHRFAPDQLTKYRWVWQRAFLLIGFGAATFLAAIFGLNLTNHPQHIPVIWLPSGIVLSTLLLTPRNRWLPIFLVYALAIFLAFLVEDFAIGSNIGFTFAYTAEALLAALTAQRIIGQKSNIFSLRQLGLAVLFIGTLLLLIALLGATVAYISFQGPFITTFLAWAMADGMGILILVPIVVAWSKEKPAFHKIHRGTVIESLSVLTLMVFTTWLVFFSIPRVSGILLSLPFVAYPFLFWAVFRLGTFGAASASSLLAVIALWSAIQGYGPFSSIDTTFESRILSVQVYLLTSTLFAWMVVALINERQMVEKAWQSSEKHLRSILQNAPVFIGQIEPGGKMSFNNWLEQNEVEPFRFFAPLTTESESLLSDAIKISRTTGKPWQAEVAAHVNGKQNWYEVQLNPILADGSVESIILTANEITERKSAEAALRESEERFSVAVRGANDGIWDWDIMHNKIYYSLRWKRMLGYSDNDISDSPDEWMGRIHPDDIKQVKNDLNAHIEGFTPHFVSEHRIMHYSGSYRWVLVRGLSVRAIGSKPHRLAGSLTDITARKTTEERLLHDAMHDILTGLPNRPYFLDQLKRSIERLKRHSDYWSAVLFIDLDRFKLVNESFGHVAGDQLLIEIARRLELSLRPEDTVARFGGDEFAILLDDIKSEDDAIRVADRVRETMNLPFYLQSQEVFTTVSIGIVVNMGNYERAEDLLRDSDTALYEAKASGRARYQTFDANIRIRNLALLQLETDLRRALERQEFEVYYQPIVSLPSGTISSMEALVRWHHPERGLILPSDFIPQAEENGLIVPLNDWVIRTACNQLHDWLVISPNMRVSVNLSARQLQNPTLPEQFKHILNEAGIEGRSLILEFPESAATENFDLTIRILTEISAMGIQISLDDFGMHYSSLDYLKRFPVNTIKIDKSFIWNIPDDGEDAAITRTIISVGHLLNKLVVAEGVESPRQLDFLHQHQCDAVQGFLYSEPKNSTAITTMLENGSFLLPLIPGFPKEDTE